MSQPPYQPMHQANPVLQEIERESMTALITGILSFICCFLIGIWSIISANKVNRLIAQSGVGYEHQSKATIGKILAIVSIVLNLLSILMGVVWVIFAIFLSAAGAAAGP